MIICYASLLSPLRNSSLWAGAAFKVSMYCGSNENFFPGKKWAGTGPFVCPEVTHAGYQTKKTDGGMR